MTRTIPALTVIGGNRFHADSGCYSPLRRLGVVSDASMLIAAGKKPCRKCWKPEGYTFSMIPEQWEIKQFFQAEEGGVAAD